MYLTVTTMQQQERPVKSLSEATTNGDHVSMFHNIATRMVHKWRLQFNSAQHVAQRHATLPVRAQR